MEPVPDIEPVEPATRPAPPRSRNLGVGALVALLLAIQVVLLIAVLRTNNQVSELREDIDALGTARVNVPPLADVDTGQASPGPTLDDPESASPPPAGDLPRFLGDGPDSALGRNIGEVTGLEYYSGETTALTIDSGISRAYMVWAHWCPFCQEELPVMADWQNESAGSFDHFELITVTTAMDETASNPLVPYLDDNEFPFPVLVDEDGSLSRRLGVNAFPFWVFVAPDGTVVGRAAGFIELDDLAEIFQLLDDMGAGSPSALFSSD